MVTGSLYRLITVIFPILIITMLDAELSDVLDRTYVGSFICVSD